MDAAGRRRSSARAARALVLGRRARWAPLSLRPGDLPRPASGAGRGVRDRINDRLAACGLSPADHVLVLTQPRSWGWLFNSVSFYFCYLRAIPVTAAALRRVAWRYPLQNVRTLARMYGQAARLWLKGAPFHPHPAKLEEAKSS